MQTFSGIGTRAEAASTTAHQGAPHALSVKGIDRKGTAMKIGWVGIGRMGLPMVNRLLDANYPLTVWNRTREKAAPLAQRGVTIVDKIADLQDADVVFTMLSTGRDLLAVCFDDN